MALHNVDKTVLRSVRRTNVEQTLSGMRRFLRHGHWIERTNRYSAKAVIRIRADARRGVLPEPRQLARYIAASSVLHCADGWSYLGKALVSFLRGDPHSACHLAYYAELRAALSLLASEGIGIFSNLHFVINAPDSVRPFRHQKPRLGTHKIAWATLEHWSGLLRSGTVFASVVRPHGISLQDWLEPFGGIAPQAANWFRQWGMDLRMLADDHDARNESSYRPEGVASFSELNPDENLTFASDLWHALEPDPASLFQNIDRHIFRIALENLFVAQIGRRPTDDPPAFRVFVDRSIAPQGLGGPLQAALTDFLMRVTVPNNLSIFSMSSIPADGRPSDSAAMLARATLLLRVATGSSSSLMTASGIGGDEYRFWWQALGQRRGIWEGQRNREDLLDLWEDIRALLAEAARVQAATPAPDQNYFQYGRDLPGAILGFGSTERVAIWGLVT